MDRKGYGVKFENFSASKELIIPDFTCTHPITYNLFLSMYSYTLN